MVGNVSESWLEPDVAEAMQLSIYNDLLSWMNHSVNPEVGKNVNINNFAIIQSDYTQDVRDLYGIRIYRIGGDNFVSNEDQSIICKNVNSNNKYYVGFNNKGHFSTLFIKGIADSSAIHKVVYDFLDDGHIVKKPSYTIISDQANCEWK